MASILESILGPFQQNGTPAPATEGTATGAVNAQQTPPKDAIERNTS